MRAIGSPNIDCRQDGSVLHPEHGRASYVFNATIEGIEAADAILIVGANPRREAAVLNARIRKRWLASPLPIAVVGERAELTYEYTYLGAGTDTLAELIAGKHAFKGILEEAVRPLILIGAGALSGADGSAVLAAVARLAAATGTIGDDWNGFSVLHTAASRVGGLDLGLVPGQGGKSAREMIAAAGEGGLDVLFVHGADEFDMDLLGSTFVVYLGTHGDAGAHRADVILPGAAYAEKSGTYVNTEGRPQYAGRGAFPPGEAREDWAILRALSERTGQKLGFDSLDALRTAMLGEQPLLAAVDEVAENDATGLRALAELDLALPRGVALRSAVTDFYLTNPIARASAVMAECSALAMARAAEAAE